jgi:Uma2 family endonuclease
MTDLQAPILNEAWVTVSWDEYLQLVNNPIYDKAKCYYHQGQLRIEMPPVGCDHSSDNTVITLAVNLFGIAKSISLRGLTNCSYRNQGRQECQPDVSYYIGERSLIIPRGTKIVNLNEYPPPDLVIEVGDSSISDDLNRKKQLYEELKVAEYWALNVAKAKLSAFAISEASQLITESRVLPGLAINLLEQALQRSWSHDQTEVGNWLFQAFQRF